MLPAYVGRMVCASLILSSCVVLTHAYRFDAISANRARTEEAELDRLSDAVLQHSQAGDGTCQYSQTVSAHGDHGYPRSESLVGICPAGALNEICMKKNKGKYLLETSWKESIVSQTVSSYAIEMPSWTSLVEEIAAWGMS